MAIREELFEAEELLKQMATWNPKAVRVMEIFNPIFEREHDKDVRDRMNMNESYYGQQTPIKMLQYAIQALTNVPKMCEHAYEDVGKMDERTNDVLHALELLNLSKQEENDLLQELKQIRKQRRIAKDYVEMATPLADYAKKNLQVAKDMQRLLTEMQRIEQKFEKRTYRPREMTAMELAFKQAAATKE